MLMTFPAYANSGGNLDFFFNIDFSVSPSSVAFWAGAGGVMMLGSVGCWGGVLCVYVFCAGVFGFFLFFFVQRISETSAGASLLPPSGSVHPLQQADKLFSMGADRYGRSRRFSFFRGGAVPRFAFLVLV